MIIIERAGRSMHGILLDHPIRGVIAVYECGVAGCSSAFVSTCDHRSKYDCADDHVEAAVTWLLTHECAVSRPLLGHAMVGEA